MVAVARAMAVAVAVVFALEVLVRGGCFTS